jgi:phasin
MVRRTKNVALHKKMDYMKVIPKQDGFVKPLTQRSRKMAKTAEKTSEFIENIEFPSFDASKATDQFRALAEKSAEQSKEAYAKLKSGAEDAQKAIESTLETAKSVSGDLSLKTLSAFRSNTEAGFAHLEALVGAKSLSEVIELQTAFLRGRAEAGVEQAKDFQAAASKAAEKVAAPMKTVFEKAVKELKVA